MALTLADLAKIFELDFQLSPRIDPLSREQADELAALSGLQAAGLGDPKGLPTARPGFGGNEKNRVLSTGELIIGGKTPPTDSLFAQFFTPFTEEQLQAQRLDFEGTFSFPEVARLVQDSAKGGADIIPGFGGVPSDLLFAVASGRFLNTDVLRAEAQKIIDATPSPEPEADPPPPVSDPPSAPPPEPEDPLDNLPFPGSEDPTTGEERPAKVILREQFLLATGEADPQRAFRARLRRGRGSTILGSTLGDVEILGGN